MKICLGHYVSNNFSKPRGKRYQVIELTDVGTSMILKSANLDDAHLNYLVPFPIRYKQIWSQVDKGSTFFAWKPVPPNKNYVALGMVGTTENKEPPLQAVRCVPIGWCTPTKVTPLKLWDDSGTGGKRGSFWIVNSFGTVVFNSGHLAPAGPFYDLKEKRFMASQGYTKGAHSLKPDLDAYQA